MGFNNAGMEAAARNLGRAREGERASSASISAPTRTATDRIADYVLGFAALAPLADYVTVNVSSPNTPGLRGLQNREELTRLLDGLIGRACEQTAHETASCSRSRPIWTSTPWTRSPMWCGPAASKA